ncbi:uncharacterized protein LOC132066310 [Lycium ferocissimum]|uniref:uncharacterized protein LOC132066310 n=1 Tax=Lycium ferocissimum TaxID=112874 RepID=UPI0028165FE0|nr:uncharacterized protein LOC132066310 [Lycium ferocissimum]
MTNNEENVSGETIGVGNGLATASSTTERVHHNHPLYIHPSNTQGLVLTSLKLEGSENYSLWSKSMKLVLRGNNKLGFVLGTCKKSNYDEDLHELWDRCNAIVLAWIVNTVSKDLISTVIYASDAHKVREDLRERLKELWDEFKALMPPPGCGCPESKQYAITSNLRSYGSFSWALMSLILMIRVNMAVSLMFKLKAVNKQLCSVTDYKFKKKGGNHANNASTSGNGHPTSESQYQPQNFMLDKGKEVSPVAKAATHAGTTGAGIFTALLSSVVDYNWIVDTGATNHMVHNEKLLNRLNALTDISKSKVHLPTGEQVTITKTGDACVFKNKVLQDVLYIPEFKYNMFSVAKITKELNCFAALYPDFCVFQELFTGKSSSGVIVGSTISSNLVRSEHFKCNIKCLRSDYDSEFLNHQVSALLKEHDTLHQSSCVYTPQQNGVVERRHGYILDIDRALRFQASIPLRFWGDCVCTAIYLLNRIPTVMLQNKSPFEKFFGRVPSLDHLRVFGSLRYATNVKCTDKFSPRAFPAIHLGYSCSQKGYVLFGLTPKTLFNPLTVDDNFLSSCDPIPPEVVPPLPSSLSPFSFELLDPFLPSSAPVADPSSSHLPSPPSVSLQPRRSTRSSKLPIWMSDFYIPTKDAPSYPISSYVCYDHLSLAYRASLAVFSAIVEPTSFAEASKDPKWVVLTPNF